MPKVMPEDSVQSWRRGGAARDKTLLLLFQHLTEILLFLFIYFFKAMLFDSFN